MINWTVGTGGTHATWSAAITALTAASPIADDYTITQISDTVEPGLNAGPFASSCNLNGHTVVCTSGSPHNGDPTAGWVAVGALGLNEAILSLIPKGSGTFEVKNLRMLNASASAGTHGISVTSNDTVQMLIHDCMIDSPGTATDNVGLFLGADDTSTALVWNITTARNGYLGIQIEAYPNTSVTVENCTIHGGTNASGAGVKHTAFGNVTVRNCVSFSNAGADFQSTSGTPAGYNNASEDGTAITAWSSGSGNLTGIVVGDEFEATSWSSDDYVKVKTAGVCYDGGATPVITGNTAGIRGTSRPHSPDVSIGADEFYPTGGGGPGIPIAIQVAIAGY